MKTQYLFVIVSALSLMLMNCTGSSKSKHNQGLTSIETGYTISKVRTAKANQNYIAASTYEGTIIGVSEGGQVLWENKLSGFMNHDMWCADITGDGVDEIFAANADGTLYCLNHKGDLVWQFKENDAPMYSVTVIHQDKTPYVVCGGYNKNIYYLSDKGALVKTISSYSYSNENPVQPYSKAIPDSTCHLANYIRTVKKKDGKEVLAVHGVIHSMAVWARGSVYFFNPLDEKPFKTIKLKDGRPIGELRVVDTNLDGNDELLFGTSTMLDASQLLKLEMETEQQSIFNMKELKDSIDNFGYRVTQPEVIMDNNQQKYFILLGARILLVPMDLSTDGAVVLACKYSFNDMWNDKESNKIILASAQSGGSCIHIIDTSNPNWKNEYENLNPTGKIESILKNTAEIKANLKDYTAPEWEREPLPVNLLSESTRGVGDLIDELKTKYSSPVFFNKTHLGVAENSDRSDIKDERYFARRDKRRKYTATSQEIVDAVVPHYKGGEGLAFWGGHGNDPYMLRLNTVKKILDHAEGKKTVLIYPELEDHSDHFAYVMDDYFYPLAKYCRKKNANIFVRTKHSFWFSTAHLPMWNGLMSGEYSDVFVPSMEETSDKSMELSIAARMGVWACGATDSWGSRCARDNPSFDRLRQHSHQMLPNHFLRMMVYHISSGAQYLDNFPVDQPYMSLLWELIAKGALYVPKRSEIVSFSPVHIGMVKPDEHFINRSSNIKWTTFYDEEFEKNNSFVFSRLSGSWPAAPVTDWDFSKYAAGVKDRYQNFLANYSHGMVLLTAPQNGVFADEKAVRGALADHLHPLYKNISKEYLTDGRYYYSSDGKQKYAADEYYKTIQKEIESSAKQIPITVKGNVAWVAAESSPNHIRLTLIDGGYINPDDRDVFVSFHTIKPVVVKDILSGEPFEVSNARELKISIPCGSFRFIDVEIAEPLR
ncbi:PQQ-binding-like beta-propeller repeat protein [Labilibacter marinus]|uniref:PQQ-binding-like beta-propeller repeat protein n=1 Tax=Labilibacter marinus TaxID=1477105 RepID=UPI00082D535A|nr:PQQ-binding-like beta-propeller repeat protein [Labilibacter marinus]